MTDREQRAPETLEQRALDYLARNEVGGNSRHMADFVRSEMREVVKGLRESISSRSDIQIPRFVEETCRYLELKYQL